MSEIFLVMSSRGDVERHTSLPAAMKAANRINATVRVYSTTDHGATVDHKGRVCVLDGETVTLVYQRKGDAGEASSARK